MNQNSIAKSLDKDPSSKMNRALLSRQIIFYFLFAFLMVLLNIFLQNVHKYYVVPFISLNFGHIDLIARFYLSTNPYDLPELIGSAIAVIITYITKFLLDKFIVFQKSQTTIQQTGKEFMIYFSFAILTTILNIGIQFLLRLFTPESWITFRIFIALTVGYIVKFILDRRFVFNY
jgi:putative flippase GtrA